MAVQEHEARAMGYTVPYFAECDVAAFDCLVKPSADLDGTVTVWDRDEETFARLNGWLWSFEPNEEG